MILNTVAQIQVSIQRVSIVVVNSYREVIENFDLEDVCCLTFDKKNNYDNFHQGHEYMYDYAKSNFRYVLLNFANVSGFSKYFYSGNKYKEGNKQKANYLDCYNWAKKHDVDIFWWIDEDFFKYYVNDYREWVDNLFQEHNLNECIVSHKSNSHIIQRIKAKMMFKRRSQLTWTQLSSWKDGYVKFFDDWFMNNFTPEKHLLIAPIKNKDGIYYSRHYKEIDKDQIKIFKLMDEYSEHINKDNLQDFFNKLYKKMLINRMKLQNIEIANGKVMGDKEMIFYSFTINNIAESYPVVRETK